MKNKLIKIFGMAVISCFVYSTIIFATTLDPNIPSFEKGMFTLSDDGKASIISFPAGDWYRYHVQLLKRVTTIVGGSETYSYKTVGGVKKVKVDETETDFNFGSVGYYQIQVRGERLDGNYGPWCRESGQKEDPYKAGSWLNNADATYYGLPIDEDHISPGGGGESSGGDSGYGPGYVQQYMFPYGNQYAVIGPNGQIMYYFGGNSSAYGQYQNWGQYAQNSPAIQGPGYLINGNGNQSSGVITPNTGISNYQVVPSPYDNNQNYNNNQYNNNQNYNNQYNNNQNYYNPNTQNNNQYNNAPNGVPNGGSSTNNSIYNPSNTGVNGPGTSANAAPQITQGMEIGWHIDNNGRFYYQGSGQILRGTWYLIDNSYYRFNDNGYLMVNQWYQDTNTKLWYYLGGDGKMLTGWQQLNGTWYYFKPENGQGYGSMYANVALEISDNTWGRGTYAFDSNGAMVKNAWYGGYYYGSDGRQAQNTNK